MKKYILHIILCFTFFGASFLKAQQKPFITNYSPKDYNAFFQNWDIVQDTNGLMYFANHFGVLMFDGVNWDLTSLNNDGIARSLILDKYKRVIVGGFNEIGYLAPDSNGVIEYFNLSDSLTNEGITFGNVWEIIELKEDLIFITDYKWLKYDYKKLSVVDVKSFHTVEKIDNTLYVGDTEMGLKMFDGNKLVSIPQGDFFKEKRIYSILPHPKGILVGTRSNGLYLLNNNQIEKFGSNEVNDLLSKSNLYKGILLNDGNYAFGTLQNGLIVLNQNGEVESIVNKAIGLQNNNCWNLYQDNQNNIWLALDKGIAKVEYNLPYSFYTQTDGLEGTVMCIKDYKKYTYLATSLGIYKVKTDEFNHLNFELLDDINAQCWDLEEIDDKLFVATSAGLFIYDGFHFKMLTNEVCYTLLVSKYNKDLIYVGYEDNFSVVRKVNGKWKEFKFKSVEAQIRSIYEESKDKVWLGTYLDGTILVKLEHNASGLSRLILKKDYNNEQSPISGEIDVFEYDNKPVFSTDFGLYRYKIDKYNDYHFYPDSTFGVEFCNHSRLIYRLQQDSSKNVWMYAPKNDEDGDELVFFDYTNKKWVSKIFNRLPIGITYSFYPKNKHEIWLGGVEGLAIYKQQNKEQNNHFKTAITSITSTTDSLLFGSTFFNFQNVQPHYSYALNALNFNFSCTNYIYPEKNKYRYKLEGFDEHWSPWTYSTSKEYTNLPEGAYTFKVQSMDVFENVGKTASFTFTILPPWYRSIYAYIVYVLIAISIVYIIVKISIYRLQKANQKLEEVINERTKEIREQNKKIATAYSDIKDSINYAKRLQEAVIPKKQELNEVFDDTFVFFKPRDIVSGDFYWLYKQNNAKYLVVADCTGHGVPGAFVSMLGINLLNQAFVENNDYKPSELLSYLNKGVHAAFQREGNLNASDGMDLALIKIVDNHLEFSGAQRPLILVRNNELVELKGDKAPIGGRTALDFVYTDKSIKLEKNDMIYLFSDGYPDQFGGEKGKKYMIKKLKSDFTRIFSFTTIKQLEVITQNFNDWKKDFEQVDDVLLIGIKIV